MNERRYSLNEVAAYYLSTNGRYRYDIEKIASNLPEDKKGVTIDLHNVLQGYTLSGICSLLYFAPDIVEKSYIPDNGIRYTLNEKAQKEVQHYKDVIDRHTKGREKLSEEEIIFINQRLVNLEEFERMLDLEELQ